MTDRTLKPTPENWIANRITTETGATEIPLQRNGATK